MNAQDAEKRLVIKWREDHATFVQDAILGPYNAVKGTAYRMTAQQLEASAALSKLVKQKRDAQAENTLGISIMSGKGTGKDAWAAWAILWFMACWERPLSLPQWSIRL